MVNYLSTHHITSAYLPPMLLTEIALTYERTQRPITLKRILVGVEPIPQSVLQRFRNLSQDLKIINGYGPTECTICSSFYEFNVADEPERRTPIGQPLANYQIYLCDANLQPVPIGVSGEILIGGAGVARGYLNRPELTNQRFIVNPFAPEGGGRLYKTGDLARWLPDGNIEFLGRTDFQVKIRGFRIELGEIENALRATDGVQEVVVLAREDNPGDKRLVAYFVGDAERDILREQLAQRLPDYMVPSREACNNGGHTKKEDDQPITGQELDDQNFINSMHGAMLI